MKTLLFTLSMAMITLGSFALQPANACATCGCADAKAETMKPCTKCLKAGKTCNCGKKKMHDHGAAKPCKVCEASDKSAHGHKHGHDEMHINGEKTPCAACAESEMADPISSTSVTKTTTESNVTVIKETDRSNLGSLHMMSGQTTKSRYND